MVEVLEYFKDLHLQVISVQLNLTLITSCLDMKLMNSFSSITPDWSESTSSKILVVCA